MRDELEGDLELREEDAENVVGGVSYNIKQTQAPSIQSSTGAASASPYTQQSLGVFSELAPSSGGAPVAKSTESLPAGANLSVDVDG